MRVYHDFEHNKERGLLNLQQKPADVTRKLQTLASENSLLENQRI